MNKDETGIITTFDTREEADEWMIEMERQFPKYMKIRGVHIVENERLTNAELLSIAKDLLEEAAENIENCYGKEIPLTEKIRAFIGKIETGEGGRYLD
jgi:hypothetical protein